MIIKNLLHVYALLVCFITTIIMIFTLSLSLHDITNLVIPEYTYYSSLQRYASNEAYYQYYAEKDDYGNKRGNPLLSLSPAQVTDKRIHARATYLEEMKITNTTNLISKIQWMLVAFIFFFIHWRLYKRS